MLYYIIKGQIVYSRGPAAIPKTVDCNCPQTQAIDSETGLKEKLRAEQILLLLNSWRFAETRAVSLVMSGRAPVSQARACSKRHTASATSDGTRVPGALLPKQRAACSKNDL